MDERNGEYVSTLEQFADGSLKMYIQTPMASSFSTALLAILTGGTYGYEYDVVSPEKFQLRLLREDECVILLLTLSRPELMPLLEKMFSGKVLVEASKLEGQLVVTLQPMPPELMLIKEIALA